MESDTFNDFMHNLACIKDLSDKDVKYITNNNGGVIPIYSLEVSNIEYPELPNLNMLPFISDSCKAMSFKNIERYFEDLCQLRNRIIEIDGYKVGTRVLSVLCDECQIPITRDQAYFYNKESSKSLCIECANVNNQQNKLRVNVFGMYNCDICQQLIVSHAFMHNKLLNFDICLQCINNNTNDCNKLIKIKKLRLCNNNMIDPLGYTFGSIFEWIPIISVENCDEPTESDKPDKSDKSDNHGKPNQKHTIEFKDDTDNLAMSFSFATNNNGDIIYNNISVLNTIPQFIKSNKEYKKKALILMHYTTQRFAIADISVIPMMHKYGNMLYDEHVLSIKEIDCDNLKNMLQKVDDLYGDLTNNYEYGVDNTDEYDNLEITI